MADWLARPENREELVLRGQIARQARLWKRTDCNQEYLLGESGFASAKRFAGAYPDELEPAERELLAQSESHLRAQRRSRRLARATGLVLVSLLVLVTLSALWALDASRTATENLHRSRLKAADLAISRGNTPEAVVLALEAAPYLPRGAANTLSRALTGSHLVALAHEGPPLAGLPLAAAVDDRGEHLVTADPSLGVRAWRLEGQQLKPAGSAEGAQLGIHLVLFAGSGSRGTFLGVAPDGVWRLPLAEREEPDFPCGAERGGRHALAPGGRRLALSYALSPDEDALCVLDLGRPGEVAFDLAPHAGEIRSLAFSPGGERLLTAGRDGWVKVLDATDGRTLIRLPSDGPLRRVINRARFDPRGERVAVAASDHRLRVYAPDGSLRHLLGEVKEGGAARRVHDAEIKDLVFTPDGRFLVAADDDGQVVRWGMGEGPDAFVLGHHEDTVERVLMAPDGSRVLTTSRDGTARVWELASGRQAAVFSHDGAVSGAAFTAGGQRVLTASAEDGSARLWDMAPVPRLARFLPHDDHVRRVAFSGPVAGASVRLATASSSGLVKVWDLEGDDLQAVGDPSLVLAGHSGGVRHLAFSADGDRLASAGQDGTVRIWDVAAGGLPPRALCAMAAAEDGAAVNDVLFDPSPQPRWLASVAAGGEHPVRLWDPAACAPIRVEALEQVSGAGLRAAAVRQRAQGALVALGGEDGRVRVLSARDESDWRVLCDLRPHTRAVLDLDISPDGCLVASASEDRWVRLLSLASCGGEPVSVDLVGHSDAVRSVRFSADGRRVVSASLDGTARVWDVSGQEVMVLRDHNNRVYHAEFGVDDRFLLTASRDGAVRVWENPPRPPSRDPRALLVYSADVGGAPHAAFGPQGHFIAAAYWRNAAAVWQLLEPGAGHRHEPANRRAGWSASLTALALIDAAWRFRSENRLDELLQVARDTD
jgi:WD40 repeat protein